MKRATTTLGAAVLLALTLSGQMTQAAAAAPSADMAQEHRVGHTIKRDMPVIGSTSGEPRKVDVHLWYPADVRAFSGADETVYTSELHRRPLVPARWDPLEWEVKGEIARETGASGKTSGIDRSGKAFPVIVFSHGSVNDPIDYAHTLERIAGAGFVVAAPSHVNNTQDDIRRDYINGLAGSILFPCEDGRPKPCSRTNVARSMEDRVRDITATLDTLPAWLGDRADVDRAGILGHSRGTVTALAAAGGSTTWGFGPERRVKAIMGLAIGAPSITFGANLSNVTVPSLLVAGALDGTSPQVVSEDAFDGISSKEKAFVSIEKGTHRSFDSTYCDQLKAVGTVLDKNGDGEIVPELDKNVNGRIDASELDGARSILDLHTVRTIARPGNSGYPVQYCSPETFTEPTNIQPLIDALTPSTAPRDLRFEGLETDEVKDGVKELAVTFFGTVLKREGNDGIHFTRYLAPKWLEKHEPMVARAEAYATADDICPPGQDVHCED